MPLYRKSKSRRLTASASASASARVLILRNQYDRIDLNSQFSVIAHRPEYRVQYVRESCERIVIENEDVATGAIVE